MIKPPAGFFSVGIPELPLSLSCLQTPGCSARSWETAKKPSIQSAGLLSYLLDSIPKHQTLWDNSRQKEELHRSCEVCCIWTFSSVAHWKTMLHIESKERGSKQFRKQLTWLSSLEEKICTPPRWSTHTWETIAPDTHSTAWDTYSCQGAFSVQCLCFQKGSCTHWAVRVSYTNMTLRTLLRTEWQLFSCSSVDSYFVCVKQNILFSPMKDCLFWGWVHFLA